MPTGFKYIQSNFEALCSGLGLRPDQISFIVPIEYQKYRGQYGIELAFESSVFCGSKESCERHLHQYPNCKII